MSLVVRAALFAARAHHRAGQRRKYTLAPYIVHPEAVAALVCSVPHTEEQHAASWLHDVVEDCGVPLTLIREEFGEEVVRLVGDLMDVSRPEDGRRMLPDGSEVPIWMRLGWRGAAGTSPVRGRPIGADMSPVCTSAVASRS